MVCGYGIIAVPTRIVTAELSKGNSKINTITCSVCNYSKIKHDANFCSNCGIKLL